MDRRIFVLTVAGHLAVPLAAGAQQPAARVHRIGFLGAEAASGYASRMEALREGLGQFGYVEGKNIVIEYRWAEGNQDRLPELAAELVRTKVEVIVTHAAPGTLAAKRATTTIPIVMATLGGDPVKLGVVATLARPGGNITGSVFFQSEQVAKRLELLKEIQPRIARAGVLLYGDNPANGQILQAMRSTAASLKVELLDFYAREAPDLNDAFSAMGKQRVDAVVVQESPIFIVNAKVIAELATQRRMLSAGHPALANAGSLIGYGVNLLELYRRVGYFVDRIFKGAEPRDLPIEQPTKFEFILNMKTAEALRVKFPQSILLRANQAIE